MNKENVIIITENVNIKGEDILYIKNEMYGLPDYNEYKYLMLTFSKEKKLIGNSDIVFKYDVSNFSNKYIKYLKKALRYKRHIIENIKPNESLVIDIRLLSEYDMKRIKLKNLYDALINNECTIDEVNDFLDELIESDKMPYIGHLLLDELIKIGVSMDKISKLRLFDKGFISLKDKVSITKLSKNRFFIKSYNNPNNSSVRDAFNYVLE